MEDFRNSPVMYALGVAVVIFILAQSAFFMKKAWSRGKELGISSSTLKTTVVNSALFTVAPAISILATVLTLAGALGMVLPWIRLTVIGNLSYETAAATSAIEAQGGTGLSAAIIDPTMFGTVFWVMTIGSILPLILLPIFLKKIQKKISGTMNANKKWADVMSAAAFIGLIAAFIGKAIAGVGEKVQTVLNEAGEVVRTIENPVKGDGAGVLSVSVLIFAILLMLFLEWACKKFKIKWLESFTIPISMFGAMGIAVLLVQVLPGDIAWFEWRY